MAPLPTVTESPRVMLIQLSGDGSGVTGSFKPSGLFPPALQK